jgi:uncharacterized protein (DUF58 family)
MPEGKRGPRQGSLAECADLRDHLSNDGLSYLDWKEHIRLERLFRHLFVEETELSIHLLIDASQSMLYPVETASGKRTKFDHVRKLVAAMGYVSLLRYEQVHLAVFSQTAGRRVPILRGRNAAPQLFEYLENLSAGGRTDFVPALRNYVARHARPGICVVFSDFFDPHWEQGVRLLLSQRFRVVLLQILAPEEIEPDQVGDLRLVDAATGEARDVCITSSILTSYQEAFAHFCRSLEELSYKNGMDYLRTTTEISPENILLNTLGNAHLPHP